MLVRFISFFLSLLFCGPVYSGVFDHLKSVEGKRGPHSIRNIDFIYMINLDQRPEKFESCTAQLHPYGIYPYRFSAVNGWRLSLETINDLGVKFSPGMRGGFWGTTYPFDKNFEAQHELIHEYGKVYFCHCLSRGALGIVLSHLSILKDALDSGYQTIWVMEDDIYVERDPRILSDLIDKLDKTVGKERWDILFTDQDTKANRTGKYVACTTFARRPDFYPKDPGKFAHRKVVGNGFRQIGARYGAYSMILRRSGIKKILKYYREHPIFLPYDMENFLADNIRIYTVLDDVVSTQVGAVSDNGADHLPDS